VKATFRKAMVEDWQHFHALLTGMGSARNLGISHTLFKQYIKNSHHTIIVAEHQRDLLGYAWAQSYGPHLRSGDITARLNDLFVLPDYRHQGIAKGLLESVIDWAKTSGVKYLQWQASKTSASFYEKLGHVAIPDPDPEHPFFEIEF
jgi:GNAT superfamily N-acetyltransferase